MDRLRIIHANGVEILYLDYSNLKEDAMIELLLEAKNYAIAQNKKLRILNNFTNTYVTAAYMGVIRREVPKLLPLIHTQAMIGFNQPKIWILKGLNLLLSTDYQAFETEAEAIDFLCRA